MSDNNLTQQASPAQQGSQSQQQDQSGGQSQGRKPDHIAYTVTPGANGKGYFNRIGASWANQDGEGHQIKLFATPVNGEITLRTQRDERMQDYQNQQGQASQGQQQGQNQGPGYDGPSQ